MILVILANLVLLVNLAILLNLVVLDAVWHQCSKSIHNGINAHVTMLDGRLKIELLSL